MIRWKPLWLTLILSLFLVHIQAFAPTPFFAKRFADDPSPSTHSIFSIRKAAKNPSGSLIVDLPLRHPLYDQFIAKVVDVSEFVDSSLRDANRTFLQSRDDGESIRIHSLSPGHTYSVSVIGRKDERSELIKEELVTTDPTAPTFRSDGSTVSIYPTNITFKTTKPEKALQDSFQIEYRQLDPEKTYPVLEVLDIPEQRSLEVYLGNLNPGREYAVSVTATKDHLHSRPWTVTVATKPNPVEELSAWDNSSNCVSLVWHMSSENGADGFNITYGAKNNATAISVAVAASVRSTLLCDSIVPGVSYVFSIAVRKGDRLSEAVSAFHSLKPLAPPDFKVRPDVSKVKYVLTSQLENNSIYESCQVTAISETLQKIEALGAVDDQNGKKTCILILSLNPGDRYEISLWTTSNNVSSVKLHRSVVLAPAFDMKAFGLSVQESRGGVEMTWPQSDVFMSKLKDIWAKVVGLGSTLQMRVSPVQPSTADGSLRERSRKFESSPIDPVPVVVSSLRNGACYKIQLYTVTKSGIVSETRFDEMLRISAPPVNVSLDDITRTTGTLHMNLMTPDSTEPYEDCLLSLVVLDMNSHSVFDRRLPLTKVMKPVDLQGLRPFHKYTVNTQIVCGESSTTCSPSTRTMRQLSFSTRQDRPGPVQSLTARALNPYSVQVIWLPPALPNGILTHYVVEITSSDPSQKPWSQNVNFNSDRADHSIEAIIDGLHGGEKYDFTVRAVTEAGQGEENVTTFVVMPIMAPPMPTIVPQVVSDTVNSHSISLRYASSMFDPKHGKIIRSSIIVVEVTKDGRVSETWMRDDNNTYTWSQVQRFDIWPAYTAIANESPDYSVETTRTLTDTIGIEQSCDDLPTDSVCNGPLKSGTSYKFKIRLFTAPDLFTDSQYSEVVATDPLPRGATLKVVLIVLVVLVLLGLLGVLFITFWSKSKKARNAAYSSTSKESQWAALKMIMAERAADCLAKLGLDGANNGQMNVNGAMGNGAPNGMMNGLNGVDAANAGTHLQANFHHRRCRSLRERTGVDHRLERLPSGPVPKSPLYTVTSCQNVRSRPVRKSDFPDHVRIMGADSDFRFSEEYEALKNVGVGQSYHAAEYPVNRSKNRFTNILPYDHSRVKIVCASAEEDDGSDYINANYMPGFSSRREFIAAQGPLPSTRDDFWQMAWEQQCPAIIALTKCVEKGRDKCHQYWPDAERMTVIYADIEVTLVCETQYDEFVVRELRLAKMHDPSPPRLVRHLHYMAWPDFGVPDSPDGIIRFGRLFRSKLPHSPMNKPTIVHCSAGVGRSGTFMAIDRLIKTLETDRHIDVFGIVHEMRMERCQMVQNEQQYVFVHHCVLRAMQMDTSEQMSMPIALEIHQNPAFEDDEGIAESGF